jgi:hypothetical protein
MERGSNVEGGIGMSFERKVAKIGIECDGKA